VWRKAADESEHKRWEWGGGEWDWVKDERRGCVSEEKRYGVESREWKVKSKEK
ncbi:hypothetical protein BC939DRAFT_441403, partial [Gamsiella multidivaricata]|uniref:uncharacterized protein n=1 Tax=Gamsiella multidivaricata TaxID=101098 RepID=UPI0022202DFD